MADSNSFEASFDSATFLHDHSDLDNLDYENSGHTGFAKRCRILWRSCNKEEQ